MIQNFLRNLFGARPSESVGKKPRILYVVKNYPQLSQTYIKSEIEALLNDFDIRIVSTSVPNYPDSDHVPYKRISEAKRIAAYARSFKPSVVHGHYLVQAEVISETAQLLGIPFTIRAHSFDSIKSPESDGVSPHIRALGVLANSALCLGLLAFPFVRKHLETEGGVRPEKIVDAPPVLDFHKFYDRRENGDMVMNTGAAIPKKKMEDFISLAARVPGRTFNLYPIGHLSDLLKKQAEEGKSPVNIPRPVPFPQMPSVYKRHGWIVYTACPKMKTVGWPMALAEAQASGTIACIANIRPDIKDYISDAGYAYDDIGEMVSVLGSPPDKAKREMGFENARRFDIRDAKRLLTDLWEPHLK